MSVTIEKIDVLSFVITGAERLDPVRVMIENYEPGVTNGAKVIHTQRLKSDPGGNLLS